MLGSQHSVSQKHWGVILSGSPSWLQIAQGKKSAPSLSAKDQSRMGQCRKQYAGFWHNEKPLWARAPHTRLLGDHAHTRPCIPLLSASAAVLCAQMTLCCLS